MKKSEIIKEAKRVLKIEIDSAKTLSSTFNNAFYNVFLFNDVLTIC